MEKRKLVGITAFAAFMFVTMVQTKADIVVNVNDAGGNVTFSSSGGAFDLTGLAFGVGGYVTGAGQGFFDPVNPTFIVGGGNPVDFYRGVTVFPANFGTGALFINTTGATGVGYGASHPAYGTGTTSLLVPVGYVSGGALGAVTSTYVGQNFASMGLTPGTYVWRWGTGAPNQSLTLNITSVPEPSTAGLVGLAVFGFGLMRRRK
jgi:hypothetical protein